MVSTARGIAPQSALEDPLAHLPRSSMLAYKKGQSIYGRNHHSTNIYLVIEGRVKVARISADGRQVILDIYQTDEFFGESALLNLPRRAEEAVAMESTQLMFWSAAEIEDMVTMRPRLSVALLQVLTERTLEFGRRIESFSLDNVTRRLARSLIRFSERSGTPEQDGSVRLSPFTHEMLSQYVGTSREIVTHCMNRFRREGYLRYSRKGINLYQDAFSEWLRQNT